MQLAQLNIALAKYPLDGPELKDFMDNLDSVNAIAEGSASPLIIKGLVYLIPIIFHND
ncbi:DUF3291 domain-containing protein [Shewanella sp. 10N.286.48.B5]|uniref:DUF3291 domain-containing protein n=1 Tax=Shewanella sp. 10N.286.48.B5 TaxID=1880834 RepID=UPI00268A7AFF